MAKRIKIKPGDVYQIGLAPGYVGYGRVLEARKGYEALHELYKLDPAKPHSLEQLREAEPLTFLWGSSAMIVTGEWPIVGHLPVPQAYAKIRFCRVDDIFGYATIYDRDGNATHISLPELETLRQQETLYEYGSFGYEAIRSYYAHLLKQSGLMPEDLPARDETPGFVPVDIFDFDLAEDVRKDFEVRLKRGKSVEEATRLVLRKYKFALEDEDDTATVYLALAALQAERGGIRSDIKPMVEAAIEHDLARWEHEAPERYEARKAVLQRLQEHLA